MRDTMTGSCRAALVAASLLAAASARAQDSVVVAGKVTDSTGVAVVGAEITVLPGDRLVRTDSAGEFSLRLPVGRVTLHARRVGYQQVTRALDLRAGRHQIVRLQMHRLAQALPTVETRARASYMPPDAPVFLDDFYRRKAEGKGRYFTRDELRVIGSTAAAIGAVASLRVRSDAFGRIVSVQATRCSSVGSPVALVAWFVDGFRVGDIPEIPFDDVEAIEVYRGSSSLPAEAIGNACAAIYIWTRRGP